MSLTLIIGRLLNKSLESRPFNARALQGQLLILQGQSAQSHDAPNVAAAQAVDLISAEIRNRIQKTWNNERRVKPFWLKVVIVILVLAAIFFAGWLAGETD